MSKYDTVYFVGDNQAINRVRGTFSGSLAALYFTVKYIAFSMKLVFTDVSCCFVTTLKTYLRLSEMIAVTDIKTSSYISE